MAQFVIKNIVRAKAAEDMEKLQKQLQAAYGTPDQMGLIVVEHFNVMLPQLLDTMDQFLKDAISQCVASLKEQGLLSESVDIIVTGNKEYDEEEDPLTIQVDLIQ
jgi:hypothetical protein